MPKIETRNRQLPEIGALRNRVIVCTTIERPDEDVSTIVNRPGVMVVHARVRPLKGHEVLDWKAVFDSVKVPTHEIIIRTPPDVKIDLNHWVYVFGGYDESWYRVRNVEDIGGVCRFTFMLCSLETTLDRRSDPATQASPPVWETPEMD